MRQDQKLGQQHRRYSFFRVLSGQDASTINTYTYIYGFILSPIYSVTKKLISPRKINIVNISTTTITLDYYKYFFKRLISNTETNIFVKNTTTNTWSYILQTRTMRDVKQGRKSPPDRETPPYEHSLLVISKITGIATESKALRITKLLVYLL